MSLDKKDLEARVSKLEKDISTVQQSLVDLEKTRNERIAQLNAMQGATQQCQIFLKEFKEDNNDDGGLGVDSAKDPNTKLADLGGL